MRDTLVILAAIALIATSANAVVIDADATYSGAANVETGIDVGSGAATAAATVTVQAGADLTVTTDLFTVGAGSSYNAGLVIEAGATVNADGNYYWPPEQEHHTMDIGAESDATATIAGTLNLSYEMGIGQDYTWSANAAADVTITGTITGGAWIMFGATETAGGPETIVRSSSPADVSAMTYFHTGGTLELTGTTTVKSYRGRNYGEEKTVVKAKGAAPHILATGGCGQQQGITLDVSECTIPELTWHRLLEGITAWNRYWYLGSSHAVDWETGTNEYTGPGDTGWLKRHRSILEDVGGEEKIVQMTEIFYVPEPATMVLLAIGGIGVLLRKKR